MQSDPHVAKALEVLFALGYLDMGMTIGQSDSSKIMFMDPRSIPATLAGIKSILGDDFTGGNLDGFDQIVDGD